MTAGANCFAHGFVHKLLRGVVCESTGLGKVEPRLELYEFRNCGYPLKEALFVVKIDGR